MSDLKEALEIIIDTIEDEDFQPCFDLENFMVGPALLGNLTRVHDALVKVAAGLARLRKVEKAAITALKCMEHFLPDAALAEINSGEHSVEHRAEALLVGQVKHNLRAALRAELEKGEG